MSYNRYVLSSNIMACSTFRLIFIKHLAKNNIYPHQSLSVNHSMEVCPCSSCGQIFTVHNLTV